MTFRRDARKIARTVDTINKVAEKLGPKVCDTGLAGSVNLEPDGPACTAAQRTYVGLVLDAAVREGLIAEKPDFGKDLTIGQAEALLTAFGVDTAELYAGARDWGGGKDQQAWRSAR